MDIAEEVMARVRAWLSYEYDPDTRERVQYLLENDPAALQDSFGADLEFGTGGMRGLMGVGPNRLNIYTVGRATQGLANYLRKNNAEVNELRVALAYDCRNNSSRFAEISADTLAANGIRVFLFESLRPTPQLSFTVRTLACHAGIVITASHNPKEYNGYKAYWDDGAQLVAPHDTDVIKEVNKITDISNIRFEANPSLIEMIGEDIDNIFVEKIKTLSLSPDAIARHKDLKIVYSPIHGCGAKLVPMALRAFGFENVIKVDEQFVLSGDFPTVVSPNPEESAALDLAIKKAKTVDADIVMASDPDCDRIGIAVKNEKGEWVLINGNQTCMVFTYYLIKKWQELGKLKGNEYVVKTIVTTELIKDIARKANVELYDCYTGFKWIAAVMRENEGKKIYIGGGEESYGYLIEDFCRDKDAVSACAIMAEITAWAKDNGKTWLELLQDLYVEYGYGKEKGISVVRKGQSGAAEIKQMMTDFRNNPPREIAGSKVRLIKDYQTLTAKDLSAGTETPVEMSTTSNVLQFFTEDGTKISVRPSGTEPKIKFYIEVRGEMKSRADYYDAEAKADRKIDAVRKDLEI